MAEADDGVETLERGNVYFFYRPRVEEEEPEGRGDVQNLYMVLSPHGKTEYRLAIIGREELPDPEAGGRQRYWGFVTGVERDPKTIVRELGPEEYETETRGERHQPAARPAGEGVYRVLRHGDHTHLVYALELPESPGEVQRDLGIEEEASYILSIKNPETPSPARAGLPESREAEFPKRLQEVFRGRKFSEADPPDFLGYAGCEFVLIGASGDVRKELGLELEPQEEEVSTAEVFNDLRAERSKQPVEPLLEGAWA